MDVNLHSLQGWTLQPRPDVMPGQIPSDPLHQGGGGGGAGQLLVDGCRCGQLQVGRVHTGQDKDLAKQGEEVCILVCILDFTEVKFTDVCCQRWELPSKCIPTNRILILYRKRSVA